MVLPLWEVESLSSLRDGYRDRQINREKDRECIRQRKKEKKEKEEEEWREKWISYSCGTAENKVYEPKPKAWS